MLLRIFAFSLCSCLFSILAVADQVLQEFWVPVPPPEPFPVLVPSPGQSLRERIDCFLNRYRLSEDSVNIIAHGVMLQIQNVHGNYAVSISDQDLLLFLIDRLGVSPVQRLTVRDRALATESEDRASWAALVRAVLESHNLGEVAINDSLYRIGTYLRNGSCLFEAYWNAFFYAQGFSEIQAERAGQRMLAFIREGTSVLHAYWSCVFQQFGFSEQRIYPRVMHAIDLAGRGLPFVDVLAHVLFHTPAGMHVAQANVFTSRIRQESPLVEAFYYAHYSEVLSPSDALVAAETHVSELDMLGTFPGRFERIIYQQYGFPESLARAAVDVLQFLRRQYPGVDGQRLFWCAAFRVLGLGGVAFSSVYPVMMDEVSEGIPLLRAFERAYIQGMGYGEINFDPFFERLDQALMHWGNEEPRVETFIKMLWETVFPESDIDGAFEAFLQHPSSLLGVLRTLIFKRQRSGGLPLDF